jgi:sugar phosphate isomerase/epimerase
MDAVGCLSLSTCWNGHRYSDGLLLAKEVRDMGFEWLEISHGTPVTLLPGLLQAAEKGVVKVSSLHAPCPAALEVQGDAPDAFEFTSPRAEVRRRALALTVATLEMAAKFGVGRVVLHLGRVAMPDATARLEAMALTGGLHGRDYVGEKLKAVTQRAKSAPQAMKRVEEALQELLPHCEKHQVRLGLETRSHFEQVPSVAEMQQLLAAFGESGWIGAWHDFGHVQRQANLGFLDHAAFLGEIALRLIGCHVHDVQWPHRDHQIPLRYGGVDFDRLLPLVPPEVPLIWEMSPRQKRLEIMAARERWQKRFGLAENGRLDVGIRS